MTVLQISWLWPYFKSLDYDRTSRSLFQKRALGTKIYIYVFYYRLVSRLARRMPLVEQKLFTLPEHLSLSPVFNGVRVTRSLVLCVCFVDRSLSFCTFSFGHCVVCSSIYGFWLPIWYLQTLFIMIYILDLSHVINVNWLSTLYKRSCWSNVNAGNILILQSNLNK